MPEISRKSRSFGESVIRRMTRVATQRGGVAAALGFITGARSGEGFEKK
ncbi:MAG TPA: hypothetical protein VN445_03215 [Rectinemataceae bacterium]|nr:hypothetical protein [Rectinemataceae bacterium]